LQNFLVGGKKQHPTTGRGHRKKKQRKWQSFPTACTSRGGAPPRQQRQRTLSFIVEEKIRRDHPAMNIAAKTPRERHMLELRRKPGGSFIPSEGGDLEHHAQVPWQISCTGEKDTTCQEKAPPVPPRMGTSFSREGKKGRNSRQEEGTKNGPNRSPYQGDKKAGPRSNRPGGKQCNLAPRLSLQNEILGGSSA